MPILGFDADFRQISIIFDTDFGKCMQSLWIFMRQHNLHEAIRSSLEPFGELVYCDPKAGDTERHVDIIPLYALSNIAIP